MSGFRAVFKRELKAYFATPIAYVFLVIFLFFAGYLTFRNGFYEIRQADMRTFFSNLPLLFVFMVPSTAMRLWSEERKSGSIEILLTLPITVPQAQVHRSLGIPRYRTAADLPRPCHGLLSRRP
jgi:ABC-2 type transport system permease protein